MQFTGTVVDGHKRGRDIGFPTANLEINEDLALDEGVYVAEVQFDEWVPAVCHFGAVETFDQGTSFEVHILDFSGDLYGQELKVRLHQRLREVQKFPSPEALTAQLQTDILRARKWFVRRQVRMSWKTISSDQRDDYAQAACEAVVEMESFQSAKAIFAYAPDDYEIGFVEKLCKKLPDKMWYFPKIEDGQMNFYPAKYEDLQPGYLGLLEPAPHPGTLDPGMVLVPAVAATPDGHRLGRGGGFYDRFLKNSRENSRVILKTICVLPEFAVFDDLPVEEHDQCVDKTLKIA